MISWDGYDKVCSEGFEERCRENTHTIPLSQFKKRTLPTTSEDLWERFQSASSPFFLVSEVTTDLYLCLLLLESGKGLVKAPINIACWNDVMWLLRLGHKKDVASAWNFLSGTCPGSSIFISVKARSHKASMCRYSGWQRQLSYWAVPADDTSRLTNVTERCFRYLSFQPLVFQLRAPTSWNGDKLSLLTLCTFMTHRNCERW